jgi:hypothetical protein
LNSDLCRFILDDGSLGELATGATVNRIGRFRGRSLLPVDAVDLGEEGLAAPFLADADRVARLEGDDQSSLAVRRVDGAAPHLAHESVIRRRSWLWRDRRRALPALRNQGRTPGVVVSATGNTRAASIPPSTRSWSLRWAM